jgi:hypothetical protein
VTHSSPETTPPGSEQPHIFNPGYCGPERRSEFRRWREKIDTRLDEGTHAMKGVRTDLDASILALGSLKKDVSELVDLLHSVKGAFRVLGWIGAAARPIGFIVATCAAIVGLFTEIGRASCRERV